MSFGIGEFLLYHFGSVFVVQMIKLDQFGSVIVVHTTYDNLEDINNE